MKLSQPQSVRTIFFDAGFTLLHPSPSTFGVCQQVCQQLDIQINPDRLQQAIIGASHSHFHQLQSNRQTWADEQAIADFWLSYFTDLLQPLVAKQDEPRLDQLIQATTAAFKKHTNWQLYSDVKPTLEAFRSKKYTMGVISDWNSALGPLLHRFDLTQYFDCVIISSVARYAKPSPSLYDIALARANAISDYTIHVGDSYIHDVLGARAAGITPILLDRTATLTESQIDCLVVHSLDELLGLLEITRS